MTITDDAPRVDTTVPFADLGLPDPIVDRLAKQGKHDAFPIQAAVIPDAMAGRDVAGRAPTGSGKTLGFGLPLVAGLVDAKPRRPVALVLAPTRELAEQIMAELSPFCRAAGHWAASVYGGVGYGKQRTALDRGTELVVACPGRLEDLIQMGAVDLRDVSAVVIDEADQMADMGFLPAVRRIVEQTAPRRQVLLFSATLDGPVAKLVDDFQHDPAHHAVGPAGPDMSLADHHFWVLPREERQAVTAEVIGATGSTIVFVRTRHGADRLARQLKKFRVQAEPIHGGRSQGQRDRALAAFKQGKANALIATDVAARGIHVNGVNAVVHYDPPAEHATYVHRSGRTARAGETGVVVSLLEANQKKDALKLQRAIGLRESIVEPDVVALDRRMRAASHDTDPAATPVAGASTDRAAGCGTVKFFNPGRGYGFIVPDDGGKDLFVHYTNIERGVQRRAGDDRMLDENLRVDYVVRPGRNGPEAFEVRVV